MKDIIVLIPTLEPDEYFIKFLKEVSKNFKNVIVVNDGSGKEYNYIFEKASEYAIILKHKENRGKGRAIKTGLEYIKKHYTDKIVGVVTADSDGQHSIDDIKKVAQKLKKHPNTLILGRRNFNLKSVPRRNKFGNKITRYMLYCATGNQIYDSQTGLRGYDFKNLDKYLKIPGERFEYEMNTLIMAPKYKIKIHEIRIETIYSRVHYVTHFKPMIDSLKVYRKLYYYIALKLLTFILELILFFYFYKVLPQDNMGVFLFITMISKLIGFTMLHLINHGIGVNDSSKAFLEFEMLILATIISTLALYFLIPFKLFVLFKIIVEIVLIYITSKIKNYRVFKNQ